MDEGYGGAYLFNATPDDLEATAAEAETIQLVLSTIGNHHLAGHFMMFAEILRDTARNPEPKYQSQAVRIATDAQTKEMVLRILFELGRARGLHRPEPSTAEVWRQIHAAITVRERAENPSEDDRLAST